MTFTEFLSAAAQRGELVNTMFEERVFQLLGVLENIGSALRAEGIPHEVVGGLAVLIHVEQADPEHATLTRDVDLMVERRDLQRVQDAAAKSGFRFRHGLDMLLYGPSEKSRNAVHLVFAGEKVTPAQATPNPPLNPVAKEIYGCRAMVISVEDLLRMKLSSFRLKDQVHVKAMDAAGLIVQSTEATLSPELRERLRYTRKTE